jgi:phosphatidyl-myo-inositol dimannoside synthase
MRVCLAAKTLVRGEGGISRVARLMAKVLIDEIAQGSLQADAVVLTDRDGQGLDPRLPICGKGGSRRRFITDIMRRQLTHSHFLVDAVNIVRAHTVLPLRRPCLMFIHGDDTGEKALPHWVRCARKVDVLVANSTYTRNRAHDLHGGFDRAQVCWLGTEMDEPANTSPRFEGPPTVIMVSRLHAGEDKGHRAVIDAWPQVVSKIRDAQLIIVGYGSDEGALRAYAAKSQAASQITFTGFKTADQEIDHLWEQAWVFAMPSRNEGFGLVYIEAMRYGLPLLASARDGVPEINIDGRTGYNVELKSPGRLTECLVQLLSNPALCAQLGRNGRARWQEHFTYSAFAQRFRGVLRDFLHC